MNKNKPCPPPFIEESQGICPAPPVFQESMVKPPVKKEEECFIKHPPKVEKPDCPVKNPTTPSKVKFVDAEDIRPTDSTYTIPVKKDPETGLLYIPDSEAIVVDEELNEESRNPVENSIITKTTRQINERVDGISKRLASLPDAFTYDSVRHFLDNVYIESDPNTNSTYITKMVRTTGVEVNANELVIGTNIFIKGDGPDYWLVTKTLSPMFADGADQHATKLEFFEQIGEGGDSSVTNATTDEIDEAIKL